MKHNIMIVEDEKNQAELISRILTQKGFLTFIAGTRAEATEILSHNRIDLVLTDFCLPDGTGLDVIADIKKSSPETAFVVITAYGDVETAVKCLKNGASDFLSKPIDLLVLEKIIFKILQTKTLVEEVARLRRDLSVEYSAENICGTNEKLTAEIQKAIKVARTDAGVLILGESGTGKEIFANLIHYNGDRRDRPFIKVNCSAIPAELIESELFGHVRGSFTGAYANKTGKFEAADGGTLFLDEIGELPFALQAKLLRVLQEREIEPVGSNKPKKIDVRMVFATNRNLESAMRKKEFREDLYYRIGAISINLPPLRERRDDIPLLVKYFMKKYNERFKRNVMEISSDALDYLLKYDWPGNIRELQNVIENTMVLMSETDEVIFSRNIPDKVHGKKNLDENAGDNGLTDSEAKLVAVLESALKEGKTVEFGGVMDRLDSAAIAWCLEKFNGKKTDVARFLQMDEKSVRNKIKKYNLPY